MISFLIALAVLIGGYFIYGTLVDRLIGTDPSRPMPADTMRDGVDYMPMATWRVFLIQFLNIAGLGPIFGAIMGIMFGPAAFLWIVLGTIFAGAVHDFLSGVISIRMNGASLPEIVGHELGLTVKQIMRAFSVILLVLVGAVFVLTPADILSGLTPSWLDRTLWIVVILGYYILATLLPVDKLIGNLYPIFGFALLFMAIGLLAYLIFGPVTIPDGFTEGIHNRFIGDQTAHPLFPMMFVSIACGAISGFHATQSPMMARCLKNEKLARPVFYGAMVTEGIVALIWAAAAIAFTGGYEELSAYMASHGNSAGALVKEISFTWLGTAGGILAILGVVAAPISTGDTALRSARLIVADFMSLSQATIVKRLLISVPIFLAVFALMMIDFNVLWRYFAWSNQTLAVFTLWAVATYMARHHKAYIVALVPAMFMTAVSVSYLLFARRPEGFGLDLSVALAAGIVMATVFAGLFFRFVRGVRISARLSND